MGQGDNISNHNSLRPATGRWDLFSLLAAFCILLSPFVYLWKADQNTSPVETSPSFVGSKKCGACHQKVFEKWQGSHHDLAMDVASDQTVLGDFNNALYKDPHAETTNRFYRDKGKFYVEIQAKGKGKKTYAITHTFGVYPLQQYLVPLPGGRLQSFNIAWNVKEKKWYRVPPYEVDGQDDWLHWTGGGQTWNAMCAECHSTRLQKGFKPESNTYTTTWFEIDVGCEACHGPGSSHVTWAEKPPMGRPEVENYQLVTDTSIVENTRQISLCAPCHSRRFQLGDNTHEGGELLDTMVPSLLNEGLYHPDGQILGEVYVYGSFVQSKMYRHGVRCSDCHDMHSLELHRKDNEVCLQCHRAETYDSQTHHFHKREHQGKPSKGYLCVKCHMPGQVYMGLDYRPDHSIRVPRPDLSRTIGVPNSCSTADCHKDKGLDWVTDNYNKWYGIARKPHYGTLLAAGRNHDAQALKGLVQLSGDPLLAGIVRATALTLLADYNSNTTAPAFIKALEDSDPLIRYTAIRNIDTLEPTTRVKLLEPKLYDQVKAVRIEAAAALARHKKSIKPENKEAFDKALAQYRQSMSYNSDFAPQRYNLGNLEVALGNPENALDYYREAIAIDAYFYPAKVNLAMALNNKGEKEEAAELLKQVVGEQPELYEVFYSLGLLLAEMQKYESAATSLKEAADGMPGFTRARFNYALVLLKLQHWQEGEQQLLWVLEAEPLNTQYFTTLADLYLRFGMKERARTLAQRILEKNPEFEAGQQLFNALQ